MSKSHTEWKVGVFVLISLLLMAAVVLRFSKGTSLFAQTYELRMKANNVGGIIPGAMVLMAGVPVGSVVATELEPEGKAVFIHLKILKKYPIHGDAVFSLNQTGFLGDRYVLIVPTTNALPVLTNGAVVICQEPFDLLEVARTAGGVLRQVDDIAKTLNDAVTRIDRELLSRDTLSNVTATVANFRLISERSLATLNGVEQFVKTNTHPMNVSLSNLVAFSDQLNQVARELHVAVATNRPQVRSTIKNIESASVQVDKLLSELQAGQGLMGNLLKNEHLEREFLSTMNNLSLLSSNLNKFGLLWKPKPKPPAEEHGSAYPRSIF